MKKMLRTHKKVQSKQKTTARAMHLSLFARLTRSKKHVGLYSAVGVLIVAACSVALLANAQGDSLLGGITKKEVSKTVASVDGQSDVVSKTKAAAKNDGSHKTTSTSKDTKTTKSTDATLNAGAAPMTPPVASIAKPAWTGRSLYVDPNNGASAYAAAHPGADGASQLAHMGQQPVARWFGSWDGNVTAAVNGYVATAAARGSVPVLVLYNIPGRDCGSYSAGGSSSDAAYLQWVRQAAAGVAGRSAVIILEPDALAGANCLSSAGQQGRFQLLAQAVTILKAQPNSAVYLDAGNPNWQSAATMASRLNSANIAAADGFSLNVSNFVSTASNVAYGEQIAELVGGKHYVIDTSRNGGNANLANGPFNPPSAALGQTPTTRTASSRADGYLWIKTPWESDGPVNGGPAAGQPYWTYAVQLARGAGW